MVMIIDGLLRSLVLAVMSKHQYSHWGEREQFPVNAQTFGMSSMMSLAAPVSQMFFGGAQDGAENLHVRHHRSADLTNQQAEDLFLREMGWVGEMGNGLVL